jgi:ABC-type polysaccharide/polyol phosphate export permease
MMLLGSGIGLISSVISIVAPDLNRGIGFVMGLIMYVTPVIYSDKVDNPLLQTIIKWNPLTYLIGATQRFNDLWANRTFRQVFNCFRNFSSIFPYNLAIVLSFGRKSN